MSPTTLHYRRGITLLEVIISLGILSIGLASVVALVPAGGEQAAKAIIEDRRGALGPNALADCVNRGLLDPTKWSPAQTVAVNYRVVFDPVPAGGLACAGLQNVTVTGFTAGVMADEIFRGQDDVAYRLPDNDDAHALPLFFGGPAKRLSEGTHTWLATLVPLTADSPLHRLTAITMHRRGDSLSGSWNFPSGFASGPTIEFTAPPSFTKENAVRFFPPGAPILLTDGNTVHEWRKVVMSSPILAAGGGVSQVVLTLHRDAPDPLTPNTTLHAIEGANGMYEKAVRIEEMSPWSQ